MIFHLIEMIAHFSVQLLRIAIINTFFLIHRDGNGMCRIDRWYACDVPREGLAYLLTP